MVKLLAKHRCWYQHSPKPAKTAEDNTVLIITHFREHVSVSNNKYSIVFFFANKKLQKIQLLYFMRRQPQIIKLFSFICLYEKKPLKIIFF